MKKITFIAELDLKTERLDTFLSLQADLTRSHVQKLIRDGLVKVNGSIEKPGCKVRIHDRVELTIADQPEDGRALNNLAWLLLEEAPDELRNRVEATELARRATEVAPDDPYAAGTYGTCLLRAGDADGAREQLNRALTTPRSLPDEATDRYLLAMALSALGRSAEAAEAPPSSPRARTAPSIS